MSKKGRIVILDGPDYAGKTTVAKLLCKELGATYVREPGGTEEAEKIRNLILELGDSIDKETQMYLFSAARNELYTKRMKYLLMQDKTIVSDRSVFSSIVYQENVKMNINIYYDILQKIKCDYEIIVFIVTAPVKELMKRAKDRGETNVYDNKFIKAKRIYDEFYSIFNPALPVPCSFYRLENMDSEKTTNKILDILKEIDEKEELDWLRKEGYKWTNNKYDE